MINRSLKNLLYEQVARIGKAVSSPKRLELVELLAQGEKSVETLARKRSADIKLTSAHLRTLKEARLVTSRRDGKYIIYQLAGNDVAGLWVSLRQVAEEHLLELKIALGQMVDDPSNLSAVSREALLEQARRGDVVVIDVRPRSEYETAHLPFARSMPVTEIEKRLAELPVDIEIVAYCRGPFCLLSDEAVALLAAKGYRVRKILDGVSEWQAAGLPIELHGAPVALLREAYRSLQDGGVLSSVIHWRSDIPTSRGPSLEIRPTPEQCRAWMVEAGFRAIESVDLQSCCPFHFGLRAKR